MEDLVEKQRKKMFQLRQEELCRLTEKTLGFTESHVFDEDQYLYSQHSILKKLDKP